MDEHRVSIEAHITTSSDPLLTRNKIKDLIDHQFGIHHSTLEIETPDDSCRHPTAAKSPQRKHALIQPTFSLLMLVAACYLVTQPMNNRNSMKEHKKTIAFLGPLGTYSHLVATKRFAGCEMLPQGGILDVCAHVLGHADSFGVVPIENSSGGTINETVDVLLDATNHKIQIIEELALDVQLALLGHQGSPIKRLHSHFVPLEHCAPWIRKHLPNVEKHETSSTAAAATHAADDLYAAALCSRHLAKRFGLDILQYPVESSTPNITTFIVIASTPPTHTRTHGKKTTIALRLRNEPGSLYRFLGVLNDAQINLSRLVSRPIRGALQEYAFLVDLDGNINDDNVNAALQAAQRQSASLHICGCYPTGRIYKS